MSTRRKARETPIDWAVVRQRLAAIGAPASPEVSAASAQQVLAQRAVALAAVKIEQHAAALELIVFGLGAERCALETACLFELLRVPELTRLPGAAAHVLGVMNLRGEIVPVFDLRPLRAATIEAPGAAARLLVLGTVEPELALFVDTVHGIVQLPRAELTAAAQRAEEAWGSYVYAVTSEALVVLDAAALLGGRGLFVDDSVSPLNRQGTTA